MSNSVKGLTSRRPVQFLLAGLDISAVVAVSVLLYGWRFKQWQLPETFVFTIALIALLVVVFNIVCGNYQHRRALATTTLLWRLCWVWLLVALVVMSLIYLTGGAARFSRLWLALSLAGSLMMALALRLFLQRMVHQRWLSRLARKKVLLVGPGCKVTAMGRRMQSAPEEGYVLAGICRLRNAPDQQALQHLLHRIETLNPAEVWLCLPLDMSQSINHILHALRHMTLEIRFIPSFSDMQLSHYRLGEVAGRMSFDLSVSPIRSTASLAKRSADVMLASLICVLIAPLCLLIALAIKLTSPGPVLFSQHRLGSQGQRIKVYKFRSMRVHQEAEHQVTQATKGDSRITPLGAFLRRTSLDELPQFLNVLQGNMSIVGPRPHALAHNEQYKELVEQYMKRHKVKPGITGWAQVNGFRGETDTLDKMENRVQYDLWYINNWSLWLDLRIITLTIFKGFINKNAY